MLSKATIAKRLAKIWLRPKSLKAVSSQRSLQSWARDTSSAQLHTDVGKRKVYGTTGGNDGQDEEDGGRAKHHIWSTEEINEQLMSLYRHEPANFSDSLMNKIVYTLYKTFNFITGYKEGNASVKSVEWRLIVLESVAGVPGFVAAGFRHFRSLRQLKRDHGFIATLLEEAENERMHLLVCLDMFKASWLTRAMVIAAQVTVTPALMVVYMVHPKSMHRFVGYLEETACHTYASVIEQVLRPGTELHASWAHLPAPEIAVTYWKLPQDAKWVDALKCMFADECHHRDVNHTFAQLGAEDPNPFVLQHRREVLCEQAMKIEHVPRWPQASQAAASITGKKDQPKL